MTKCPKKGSVLPYAGKSGGLCLGFFCVLLLLLILRNAAIAQNAILRGLTLCATAIIPSLFPFMVLSEMLVAGDPCGKALNKLTHPLQRILQLPAKGCVSILLGALCGFPIGARCAVAAFERGELDRRDAERVLACANTPSPAFLIGAVGGVLWQNVALGAALYASSLLSAMTVCILSTLLERNRKKPSAPTAFPSLTITHPSPAALFCASVRTALNSILLVCAYVIFFSALVEVLQHLPFVQDLPAPLRALFFAFFELSSATERIAALTPSLQSACLTALAIGWSGLSVHCQVLSVCDGKGLSLRPYLSAKLLQAILCPLFLVVLLFLLRMTP